MTFADLCAPPPDSAECATCAAAYPRGDLLNPTLRDLVLKLEKEPLANLQTIPPPNSDLFPEASRSGLGASEPKQSQDLPLQEPETQAPLPEATPLDTAHPGSEDPNLPPTKSSAPSKK